MLVLGLDPGLATTGYGFVQGEDRNLESVAYGVIRTPAGTPTPARLLELHQRLEELLARFRPDEAAVEALFFGLNVRTAIAVSEARGVAVLALAEAGLQVAEYTPPQVKKAITGYGRASKPQVREMVRVLLGLTAVPRPDDASDALAVSICHHHSARLAELLDEAEERR